MCAIWRKELKTYFSSMTGYIIIGFFLVCIGFLFKYINLQNASPQFEYTVYNAGILLLLFVPLLTMRTFSEERHQKTELLLYALPIPLWKIVLGKYLSLVTVMALPTAMIAFYPLILNSIGAISFVNAYAALIAFFLLTAACLSIGLFVSTLTDSQMISAMITFAILLGTYLMSLLANTVSSDALANALCFAAVAILLSVLVYVMTKNYIAAYIVLAVCIAAVFAIYFINSSLLEGSFAKVLSALNLFDRLGNFMNETFDLSTVFYDLSVTGLFLFFTVQSLEKRRWS